MASTPTIFISPYRNFSIRYILYSEIFSELKKSGARIVVFVRDNDVDYYRTRLGGENVIVEPVLYEAAMRQLRGERFSRISTLARKMTSGSEDGYENTTDRSSAFIFGNWVGQTRKAAASIMAARLLAAIGNRSRAVRRGLVAVESRLYPGRMYDHYFEKYNPQMLMTSSVGYMIDPYLMRAAKRYGCKVVSILHSWDNPTTKGYRGADPDHVVAWSDIMKRELNVFHDISNERIFVGGIAHWDFYFNGRVKTRPREEFLASNRLAPDRKVLFYATSSFRLFRRTFDVIEQLLKSARKDRFACPVQLLVRLHPLYLLKRPGDEGQMVERYRERMEQLERDYRGLISFVPPMIKVLKDDIDMPVEDMYGLAETLHHCDVLLTEYSTLIIEGAIFDKPVINVGLYNYRDTERPISHLETWTHVRRILRTGATRTAYTFDELQQYVNYYLEDPSRDSAQRAALVEQEVTTNPGTAGKDIAEHILSLLDAGREQGHQKRSTATKAEVAEVGRRRNE